MERAELERLADETRKEYFREWRAKNKDKQAEHRRHYWEKKALEKLNAEQNKGA
jgi:hypothetical protein